MPNANNCLSKEPEPALLVSLSITDIDGSLSFLYYNLCLWNSLKERAPSGAHQNPTRP